MVSWLLIQRMAPTGTTLRAKNGEHIIDTLPIYDPFLFHVILKLGEAPYTLHMLTSPQLLSCFAINFV